MNAYFRSLQTYVRTRLPKYSWVGLIVAGVLCVGVVLFITREAHKASTSTPQSPAAKPTQTVDKNGAYPQHKNITATVFWVGEPGDSDNDYIQNRSSAWQEDWQGHFGGVDNPDKRCGYNPCGFAPKENPFYFALPYNDYTDDGIRSAEELKLIPWYDGKVPRGHTSLVKNRWIEITRDGKTVYAQWQDAGPFGEDDSNYVFGDAKPTESRAGLDLSPATAQYLNVDGRGTVAWRFIEESAVPAGPWKTTITRSQMDYN